MTLTGTCTQFSLDENMEAENILSSKVALKKKGDTSHEVNDRSLVFSKIRNIACKN